MDLRKRKPNRLRGYDYSREGTYFITLCVKERYALLGTVVVGGDAHIAPHVQLSAVGKVTEKYIRRIPGIDRYVIMSNHVHLTIILPPPEGGTMWASSPTYSIPQFIKSFKTLVTKELGYSLFQRSYHDRIVRSAEEYHAICAYMNNNPAKWEEDCFYRKYDHDHAPQ